MIGKGQECRYALRLPSEDQSAVAQVVESSGQSINSILVLCIRKGLPLVRQALCRDHERVTLVDPLPDSVLERIYGEPDELEDVSAEELQRFQSQTEPE